MEIIHPSVEAGSGPVTSACITTCHNEADALYKRQTAKRLTLGTITNAEMCLNNLLTRKIIDKAAIRN